MEALAVLFFAILVFLILSLKNAITNRIDSLEQEIRRLKEKIGKLPAEQIPEKIAAPPVPVTPPKQEYTWESGFKVMEEPPVIPEKKQVPEETIQAPIMLETPITATFDDSYSTAIKSSYPTKPVPGKPGFFERHPDLEKFIGENLVSKIGIAILVLAIGFFVKYAIDNNWIAPVGRVAIGILCGGILTAIGHRMRNTYTAFSSVMVGGALAVFYFTITLAYHQFHLFSQPVSFIIMVVITAFAVLLSLLYNRQELAIIALIGGFATPFMVSNGSGNYQALFTYLLILNTGLLVISYNKGWRLINILAFIFTVLLFLIWILSLPGHPVTPATTYRNGLLFATAFYLLFFVINIAHNIKENKKFIASDFSILLANTCLFFSVGLYFITLMNLTEYRGLFSLTMGVFNLGASWLLFRNQKTDKNILYLLIGLTLTFISLTAPIQLHGNHITIFWASEAVLLYWLFQKSKISIIRIASMIVWCAMMISLLMDLAFVYSNYEDKVPILANKGFITIIFCAAANYLLFLLRRKDIEVNSKDFEKIFPKEFVFRIIAIVLLFLAGIFEINYQFTSRYAGVDINILYLQLYIFLFVLVLIAITNKVKSLQLTKTFQLVLLSLCLLLYILYSVEIFYIQRQTFEQPLLRGHFIAHWLAAMPIAVIIWQIIKLVKTGDGILKTIQIPTWLLCTVIVIYLSVEVQLLVNAIFFNSNNSLETIQRVFVKTGLPILWGICSFAFMWLGMKYKSRLLRIISLTLFSITLVKLFVFDIRNIPAAGKIAAFFCLGILLLVVSFMYQRLKKIIIEDERNQEA